METKSTPKPEKVPACETCAARLRAEENPKSFMSRLWRWHTGWCPGWKSYQVYLAQEKTTASTV